MKFDSIVGHVACATTYVIFGFNIVLCRDIAVEGGMSAITILTIRCAVAAALFWLVSLFLGRERVAKGDLLRIFGASLLGIFLPQLTFLKAIASTTPVDLSIVNSITPILTMLFALVFLGEPITWRKVFGVVMSFGGVVWLILQSVAMGGGASETKPVGVLFCIANSTVFALYLSTCRPLVKRYSSVTLMKWMFLFAFLVSLPLSVPSTRVTDFGCVPVRVWWEMGYLVFFATFVAYFLIPVGQQRIRPTLVSMYGYVQPIIAISVGIMAGMDRLTLTKLVAAVLVFAGVAVVNKSRSADDGNVVKT